MCAHHQSGSAFISVLSVNVNGWEKSFSRNKKNILLLFLDVNKQNWIKKGSNNAGEETDNSE